jgi:hypothetical protein
VQQERIGDRQPIDLAAITLTINSNLAGMSFLRRMSEAAQNWPRNHIIDTVACGGKAAALSSTRIRVRSAGTIPTGANGPRPALTGGSLVGGSTAANPAAA